MASSRSDKRRQLPVPLPPFTQLKAASRELRVKAPSVVLAKLTISSDDFPNVREIIQGEPFPLPSPPQPRLNSSRRPPLAGHLSIPKLLIFREGEAMDYDGELTKEAIVEVSVRVSVCSFEG